MPSSIVESLRERKLFQWTLAYAAGAWLVLQVIDVLAPTWSLSSLFQRGAQIFLAAGLLITLVLAWYHGERGRQRASGPELLMIAALLAIAAALTAILGRGEPAPLPSVGSNPSTGAAMPSGERDLTERVLTERDPDLPSIAVLAFADMSPGSDHEYFADGIAEEILNALARLPGLKVAGRTSSFSFKGTPTDIPTIGARLGVATVLDGSLRVEGNAVRITAQLISVEDGFHLWSEEYDRELEGVFTIQEEIAREIVDALQVELGCRRPEEAWASRTTPEAYRAYLKGRQAFHDLSGAGFTRALEEYSRAAELDSTFAPALAGIAAARFALGFFGLRPMDDVVPIAEREARRALELDENLAEPHSVLALISLYHEWDWSAAEREVRRALELNPNDVLARHAYGDLLTILGDPEAGLRQVELGREAEPLSLAASGPAVAHLGFVGRYEEMIDELGMLMELFPDRTELGRPFRAAALWHLGELDAALEEYRRGSAHDPELDRLLERVSAEAGPRAAMRSWADYLAERYEPGSGDALGIAHRYARADAPDEAFRWLDAAFEERTPSLLHIRAHPDFEALRDDPRFRALLERMGIPDLDG